VPFSSELRKVAFRYGETKRKKGIHSKCGSCSRNESRLLYRNVRDLIVLLRTLCRAMNGLLSGLGGLAILSIRAPDQILKCRLLREAARCT
jgi:hypothetical protein